MLICPYVCSFSVVVLFVAMVGRFWALRHEQWVSLCWAGLCRDVGVYVAAHAGLVASAAGKCLATPAERFECEPACSTPLHVGAGIDMCLCMRCVPVVCVGVIGYYVRVVLCIAS